MDEPTTPSASPAARLPALVAGFATIYLVWGSTYLAIKFAVETLPPFLMGGTRFVTAGLILYVVRRLQGSAAPKAGDWRRGLLTGALLLLGGNGLVTWGQRVVPSGTASLLVATTPLWMVLVGWLFYRGPRPGARVVLGLGLGFAGAVLLLEPGSVACPPGCGPGVVAILLAPILWSIGSLQARRPGPAGDVLLGCALQMLAGGGLMLLAGTLLGEWPRALAGTIALRSVLSFVYLTLIGSLVGFTTYNWLLRVAPPAAVATYAYVNPLVAVLLGWGVAGEAIDRRVLLAAALIVGAVVLITPARHRAAPHAAPRLAVVRRERKQPQRTAKRACAP